MKNCAVLCIVLAIVIVGLLIKMNKDKKKNDEQKKVSLQVLHNQLVSKRGPVAPVNVSAMRATVNDQNNLEFPMSFMY